MQEILSGSSGIMLVPSRLNIKYLFPLIAGLTLVSLLLMPLTVANLWWRETFNSGHTMLFIFMSGSTCTFG